MKIRWHLNVDVSLSVKRNAQMNFAKRLALERLPDDLKKEFLTVAWETFINPEAQQDNRIRTNKDKKENTGSSLH